MSYAASCIVYHPNGTVRYPLPRRGTTSSASTLHLKSCHATKVLFLYCMYDVGVFGGVSSVFVWCVNLVM